MTFHDILLPIISTAVVILIFVITRARQQGDSSTVTNTNVQTIMKNIEDRRDEEKERDKDLRVDLRHMNESINALTNTLNLHNHMFGENKEIISNMRETVHDLKNRVYVIELKLGRNGDNKIGKGAV